MKRSLVLATLLVACGGEKKAEPTTSVEGSGSSAAAAEAGSGEGSGSSDYVPAEYKDGMAQWKDIGVYVDGKPVGFLNWGELPITLKPVFIEDEVSINKPPGCPECPDRKKASMRWYRFIDYFNAIGLDRKKIKIVHVLAPKDTQTIEASTKDLNGPLAKDFLFRFGGLVGGKALPHTPEGFGNGETPDKLMGVMIYIDRKPPVITRQGIELDGVPQSGFVPYYGEPMRGGIHVYLDDKLAAVIKRQELDVKVASKLPTGELQWGLKQFLESNAVDTSKLVEGWVIRNDKREEKIPWSELSTMNFHASSMAKGHVLLGDKKLVVNALALHTRAVKDEELPVVRPDEIW
jgi:hypothetical protein